MGDSRAFPGFGEIDLDLVESERDLSRAVPPSNRDLANRDGNLDLDLDSSFETSDVPQSSTFEKAQPLERPGSQNKRATLRKLGQEDDPKGAEHETTRIVKGDPIATLTRSEDGHPDATRAGTLEELLAISRGEIEEPEPPASIPSGSGIATRDVRVAAMRELYAKGDAEGALKLAEKLRSDSPPSLLGTVESGLDPGWGELDEPASDVEELALDIEVEFEEPAPLDGGAEARARLERLAPSTAPTTPLLTLTERQGIPRVLKSPGEVAKLPIDHRAGFLLAHIDGMQTMEEILDVCAMPPEEALQLIKQLEQAGVIAIE